MAYQHLSPYLRKIQINFRFRVIYIFNDIQCLKHKEYIHENTAKHVFSCSLSSSSSSSFSFSSSSSAKLC